MTLPAIETSASRVDVLHRLAMAVELIDASTRSPVWHGPRVGRETVRSVAEAHRAQRRGRLRPDPAIALDRRNDARYLLRHEAGVSATTVIRIADTTRTWVPRRFSLPQWSLAEVEAADASPPAGPYVPVTSRLLRPWLLPGQAYPLPRSATGLTMRVLHAGVPVRWARVEVFTAAGRVGWGHGDEHGQVLLVLTEQPAFPPAGTAEFQVAVRVHIADPTAPPPVDPGDPLADLPVEPVPRSANPPTPQNLDNDLLRGLERPAAYVTAADQVQGLTVGILSNLGDLTVAP